MADPIRARRIALEGGEGAFVLAIEDTDGRTLRFAIDDDLLDVLADDIDDRLGG